MLAVPDSWAKRFLMSCFEMMAQAKRLSEAFESVGLTVAGRTSSQQELGEEVLGRARCDGADACGDQGR